MSRFVDKSAVGRVNLGPCDCPGTPHGEDWADIRKELSASEWAVIFQRDTDLSMTVLVAGWSLADAEGDAVPITVETVSALDFATFTAIDQYVAANISPPTLPNGSSGPSRRGTRGPRSQTRPTPINGSSTTPSWQAAGVSGTSTTPLPSS